MLPFRSFEAAKLDTSGTVQNKIPDNAPGPVITATPGVPYIVPLRWNNPHASELEVNVWISNNQYVVPIRKPTCSGEGHQDNVFAFTIPADFNDLGSKVPGWTGCQKEGDCVLQIYAHSVEPRTYAIGTPLVVTGTVPAPTATSTAAIQPATQDVGLDLNKLTHDLCLSSADDAKANIPNAVPRAARLVSDVFNHAYQNSDYSPYSGQQPEAISRNLQASTIISMIPANQGELGAKLFKQQNPEGAALQAKLKAKVDNLVKAYEGVVNNIIAKIGDKTMKNTDTLGPNNIQKLATTFRAAETGSVTTQRQTTNTYVPSFQLPAAQVANARALVPNQYKGLIDAAGQVKLYEAVLNDLKGDFQKAAAKGLEFQPAMIKTTATTMADVTAFKKVNAQGKQDGGIYAATAALATKKAAKAALEMKETFIIADVPSVIDNPLSSLSADDALPDTGAEAVTVMPDTHGLNRDLECDDDTKDVPCDYSKLQPLFVMSGAEEGLAVASSNSNSAVSTAANGIILIVASAIGAFFTA